MWSTYRGEIRLLDLYLSRRSQRKRRVKCVEYRIILGGNMGYKKDTQGREYKDKQHCER
jgi:hypothetical protein